MQEKQAKFWRRSLSFFLSAAMMCSFTPVTPAMAAGQGDIAAAEEGAPAAALSLDEANVSYNEAVTRVSDLDIVVSVGGKTLTEGTDYIVTYQKLDPSADVDSGYYDVSVGEIPESPKELESYRAHITPAANSAYTGEYYAYFSIAPANHLILANITVENEEIPVQESNADVTAALGLVVRMGDKVLVEGTDYVTSVAMPYEDAPAGSATEPGRYYLQIFPIDGSGYTGIGGTFFTVVSEGGQDNGGDTQGDFSNATVGFSYDLLEASDGDVVSFRDNEGVGYVDVPIVDYLTLDDENQSTVTSDDFDATYYKDSGGVPGEQVVDNKLNESGTYWVVITPKDDNYTGSVSKKFTLKFTAFEDTVSFRYSDMYPGRYAQIYDGEVYLSGAVEGVDTYYGSPLYEGEQFKVTWLDSNKKPISGTPTKTGVYYARVDSLPGYNIPSKTLGAFKIVDDTYLETAEPISDQGDFSYYNTKNQAVTKVGDLKFDLYVVVNGEYRELTPSDYTVSYKNADGEVIDTPTALGTYKYVLKATEGSGLHGEYEGDFAIVKENGLALADLDYEFNPTSDSDLKYNVTMDGKKLVEGQDYTVSYLKLNDATGEYEKVASVDTKHEGSYRAHIVAASPEYSGDTYANFYVPAANSFMRADIILAHNEILAQASRDDVAKALGVTVKMNGETLDPSKYGVEYLSEGEVGGDTREPNVTRIGTYNLKIYPMDFQYSDANITQFSVVAGSIKGAKVMLVNAKSAGYMSKTLQPKDLKVIVNGQRINPYYYTISCRNNNGYRVGSTTTVTVTGKNGYTGTAKMTFKVTRGRFGRVKLSGATYTYNGRVKSPRLYVYNARGTRLGTANYTVQTPSGRKAVGTYTYVVRGRGNYTGTYKVSFKIVPGKTYVRYATAGRRSVKVTMPKSPSSYGASRYQVRYRVKGATRWAYKTTSGYTLTIGSLKAGKYYQIQVRPYKTVSGRNYYGAWSTVKTSGKVK